MCQWLNHHRINREEIECEQTEGRSCSSGPHRDNLLFHRHYDDDVIWSGGGLESCFLFQQPLRAASHRSESAARAAQELPRSARAGADVGEGGT